MASVFYFILFGRFVKQLKFFNKFFISVITAKHIGNLVDLLESKEINLTVAKKILIELTKHPDKLPREVRQIELICNLEIKYVQYYILSTIDNR